MWSVDSSSECCGGSTGIYEVSFCGLCYCWGMDGCVCCGVVTYVLVCLDNACVMSVLVLAFKPQKIDVNCGICVLDGGHYTVQECNIRAIDVHNCGYASLHDCPQ